VASNLPNQGNKADVVLVCSVACFAAYIAAGWATVEVNKLLGIK
jgi:hypothetical protein